MLEGKLDRGLRTRHSDQTWSSGDVSHHVNSTDGQVIRRGASACSSSESSRVRGSDSKTVPQGKAPYTGRYSSYLSEMACFRFQRII